MPGWGGQSPTLGLLTTHQYQLLHSLHRDNLPSPKPSKPGKKPLTLSPFRRMLKPLESFYTAGPTLPTWDVSGLKALGREAEHLWVYLGYQPGGDLLQCLIQELDKSV